MRHNNIVSAIEWLPEHLFTEEIVEAAVESKEIEVLSHIPGRFLTPRPSEVVLEILPDAQKGAFSKEDGEKVVDEAGKRLK